MYTYIKHTLYKRKLTANSTKHKYSALFHNKNFLVLVVHRDYEYLDSLDTRKLKPNSSNSSNTLRKKKNTRSSWSIFDNYIITLSTASKLNCDTKKASEVSIANIFQYILVIMKLT